MSSVGRLRAAAVLSVALFGLNFAVARQKPLTEIDEAAWVFSSYFYHLAFERRDLASADWRSPDALDHPPLAKYLFGAALVTGGIRLVSLEPKRWWASRDLDFLDYEAFKRECARRLPSGALSRARLLSSLAMAASGVALFALVSAALSPPAGFTALLLYGLSPLARTVAGKAVSDGIFLFLLLACALAQASWLRRAESRAGLRAASALLGAVCGLAFLTKLNGLLCLAITGVVFVLALARRLRRGEPTGDLWLSSGIILGVFALTVVALNPSLYGRPWGFICDMLEHRWRRVELQTAVLYPQALPTPQLRFSYALRSLFFTEDWFFSVARFPLLLLLSAIGLPCLVRRLPGSSDSFRVALVNALIWVPATIVLYRMNWDRYLLPVLPFLLLAAAAGAERIRLFGPQPPLLREAFVAGGLALGLAAFPAYFTGARFARSHPDWVLRADAKRLQTAVGFHPDRPELVENLAAVKERLGSAGEARQLREIALSLRKRGSPANK